jgi:hypothetical protein
MTLLSSDSVLDGRLRYTYCWASHCWRLQIATRQCDNSRRQEDAFTVVGGSLCHFRCTCTVSFVRSIREVTSSSSDPYFGSDGDYRDRIEMEAEAACLVLDYHDRSRGSSCPVGSVGSVDDQWVPAFVIIPIGMADLYFMLWILSVVGSFVKMPTISET